MAGLQGTGVAACAKHFPGHGSTEADSHVSLATVSGTLAEVRARDLPPFEAAVAAGSTLFLLPILVFTVLLRKHLLRGITFGALRK